MKVAAYIVNAFTANGKGGNPAGVVLKADRLSDLQMLEIAAELGLSETAFVCMSEKADHKVRFFTPTTEVDLCGHATIATWSLTHKKGLISPGGFLQETRAGLLGVNIAGDSLVFMEQAQAEFYDVISASEITALLGLNESAFHATLQPQIVSTGIRDLLIPLKEKQTLANLRPDLVTIAEFSREHDISGLHVFVLSQDDGSVASTRNFAPADGINEEAATGTSNGALLCYLKNYGQLTNHAVYRVEQGESMGRLSYIYGKFVKGTIWIGGEAVLVGEQEVEL